MANQFGNGRADETDETDETGDLVETSGDAEAVGVAGAVDTSSLVTRVSVRAMCCEDVLQ